MLLPKMQGAGDRRREGGGEAAYGNYASYMEGHLEGVLSQMAGVGDVTVMITLKSSAEKVVEKDVEAQSETVRSQTAREGRARPRTAAMESPPYMTEMDPRGRRLISARN